MNEFEIVCDIDVALSLTRAKTLKGDILTAKYQAMIFYVEELIMEHFGYKNPNIRYNYKPNTKKYEEWKQKYHPTAINQLVLSGRLQRAVEAAKVDRNTGKVSVSVPEYGIFQMKIHKRDFLSPNLSDTIEIQDRLRRNLFYIRSQRAKQFARKQ